MMSSAAISHTASEGSIATSTAPSATSMCDQKSPMPRVRHALASIFWKGSRRSPQPTKSEYEIDASVNCETFETEILFSFVANTCELTSVTESEYAKSSPDVSPSSKSIFPELKRTVAP